MKRLTEEIIRFFNRQHIAIVSTIGQDGVPHSACKGIVKIDPKGGVYLLDLYHGTTAENLSRNPFMSVTVVDEHTFQGWCLKGTAKLARISEAGPQLLRAWEHKLSSRITHRIIRNVQGQKGHPRHPEAHLPTPQWLIAMEVNEIVDLTPAHIRE